jgi:hypothetical protein
MAIASGAFHLKVEDLSWDFGHASGVAPFKHDPVELAIGEFGGPSNRKERRVICLNALKLQRIGIVSFRTFLPKRSGVLLTSDPARLWYPF